MNHLFDVFPYASLAVLVGGLALRYFLGRERMDGVRADVDAMRALFRGGSLWRNAIIAVVLCHLAALIVPKSILVWNSAPLRLLLLEGTGFVLGLVALVGWASVMWRLAIGNPRMKSRKGAPAAETRSSVELGDSVAFGLVFMLLASGSLTAVLYRWGSSWGAATLAPYAASVLRGAPAASLVEQMPFFVQLHVFSLFALLAVLPFSRLASFSTFAIDSVEKLAFARAARAMRMARVMAKRRRADALIWPEEVCAALTASSNDGGLRDSGVPEPSMMGETGARTT